MDTTARTPTIIAARFIEYFLRMLGLLVISATPVSYGWERLRGWQEGSSQPGVTLLAV
jgi:hypothetical protein